ncbi:sensor histidine kinase [Actinoallomurus iriomotensis]|uniref:histidine kinase n=1 Tax=Actinoallomurus iriomotensis TaxID=478107 RepID=A0A9W6S6L4_9ACTN|nr:sensor histidine kinase [Actinoallomurus iriomotensis]GLY88339.1 two-component sensor histidine kinase [Actinoallomurus iriomotensis]
MPDRFEAWLPPRRRGLLVVCALAVLCPLFFLTPRGLSSDAGRLVLAGLAVVQAGGIWWMGSRPAVVTAVVLCAGAGIQLLYPAIGPGVALVVVSTFAWLRPARASVWILAVVIALSGAIALVTGRWSDALLWLAATLLAWTWGALGRARSARRQAEAARAILEERARIARELHDVLAHTVSVMVVQASAADDVFDVSPDRARQAIRDLEGSGRQALAELRRFLRTVRTLDEAGPFDAEAAGEPQPVLADLPALARPLAAAGLEVVIRQEGLDDVTLAPGVERSAYRIVQESLTNVVRHARARTARVNIGVADGELTVEIHDDGKGGGRFADLGGGHGIAGMRERAALLGGSVEAGPAPAGGFRVCARLPLEEPA